MYQVTFVTFEVLDFCKKLLIDELFLRIANINFKVINNIPTVKIKNFPKNVDDYYIEKIEFKSNQKIIRYFRFKIYKNRVNLYYILLNKLNNFSFEIGYFNKDISKLPQTIEIKISENKYKLKPISKTDLPFVNSFGIINCDKTITINQKQEISLDGEIKGSFNVNLIASGENYMINIIKIYKSYYPELIKHMQLNTQLQSIILLVKNKINDKNTTKSNFSVFLANFNISWKNLYLEDYKDYITNKLYPLDNDDYSLLLNYTIYHIILKVDKHTESFPILKCFFNLLSKLEDKLKNNIINQRDILSFAYYFYENYCSIEKYKDCLCQKMNDYQDLYDNSSIKWIDFDIVFINEINKESAYYRAVKLLENVLDNLKPNSKLLEILYLLDSGSGNIRKKGEDDDLKTAFNLTMITKENIITHIKSIIPNIIIRKDSARNRKKSPYAECDINSGIMTIFEKTLFKKELSETKRILIDEPDVNDFFSITIFLCLLHELCSHLKLLIKEKTIKSPNIINDPYANYNKLKLKKAESGRIMEYYISKDINKIKFLKFSFSPKKDLYNHDLWTNENFENLNLVIEKLIKNSNSEEYLKYEIDYFPSKNNEEIENDNSSDNASDNENEIDWEYSSPRKSKDEKFYKNKTDIKENSFEIDNEYENYPDREDIEPIVKY